MGHKVKEIAQLVQGEILGDEERLITGVAKIEEAGNGDLCFLSNPKYQHHLQNTNAGAVIVGKEQNGIPEGLTVIRTDMPYVAFCQALIHYFDYKDPNGGIHPTAIIEDSASIGKNVHIGPHAYIGSDVVLEDGVSIHANCSIYEHSRIGANTHIYANVSIYHHSIIGADCIIHSGTVIGSDGFGHAPLPDGSYVKIPQIGNVQIGNNVEIGSNCSIDRANMGSTIIGEGCRIDNLIQIAHGVEIGKHTVVAAQAGISGSTKVGDHVVIAGQVGVVGHVTIADRVQIGAQSGVSNSITNEGEKVTDSPHLPLSQAIRSRVLYRQLPDMEKRLRELEKQLKELKENKNG